MDDGSVGCQLEMHHGPPAPGAAGLGGRGGVEDAGIRARGGVRTAPSRPRTAVSIFDAETRASRGRLSVRDGKLRGDGTKASAR